MKSFNQRFKQHIILSFMGIFLVMQLFTVFLAPTKPAITEVYAWDGISYETPEGQGTQQDPYLIATAEHLKWVSVENNAGNFSLTTYFELSAHINLEDYEWTPIGTQTNPFIGRFNGKDYSIYNLNLKDEENVFTYSGLFGYVSGAIIENVKITQVDFLIDLLETEETVYVGAVVGFATSNSTIRRIINSGTIQILNATDLVYAGGIVGYLQNSTIAQVQNSSVLSTLEVDDIYLGGVVGKIEHGTITSSYNRQTVNIASNNSLYLGGVIGEAYRTSIQKVYNEGMVTAKSKQVYLGGIAGLLSSGVEETDYNQELMYNTKKITLNATLEDEPNLYAGGLFGRVEEKNIVSYAYNSAEVAMHQEAVGETTNMGTLIGSLQFDATIQYSYYNVAYQIGGTNGVGEELGTVTDVYYASIANMRSTATYEGDKWKFGTNNDWHIIGGSVNGGLPVLRYVGNFSVHAQVFGGGTITPTGTSFYAINQEGTSSLINPVYTITANAGYQIKQIIYDGEEINSYRGKGSIAYNPSNSGMAMSDSKNLAVIFEPIPFVKTQMFYYLVVVGSLIVIMIVGTAVINYRYAIKMDKIMDTKKKSLKLEPEKTAKKEPNAKPKAKPKK